MPKKSEEHWRAMTHASGALLRLCSWGTFFWGCHPLGDPTAETSHFFNSDSSSVRHCCACRLASDSGMSGEEFANR